MPQIYNLNKPGKAALRELVTESVNAPSEVERKAADKELTAIACRVPLGQIGTFWTVLTDQYRRLEALSSEKGNNQ